MKNIWTWIKENPNRTMFLIPILLVATISISHVIVWYDIANPYNWAIFLSVAIEVGAIAALIAATNKIKGGVWFMFSLITIIQMIGNIFFSYNEIDVNGKLFKSWVELTGPIWELMGTDSTDVVGMKRWLSFLEGGLLPIISLTSLHFFVKYQKPENNENIISSESLKKQEEESEGKTVEENKDFEQVDDMSENSESILVSKGDFEKIIQEKKRKLEEDKKIFEPLLSILYKNGNVGSGEVLPTYIEFRKSVDSKYTDDNIKMFLTLCNYLDITELSDNVRKTKVNFEEASYILSKYLSLDEKKNEENQIKQEKTDQKDWWSTTKRK